MSTLSRHIAPFPNIRSLTVGIQSELKDAGLKLIARPYNRFDTYKSVWWLVHSTDWPAYSRGKIVLIPEGPHVTIGLNLEKGIDANIAPSRHLAHNSSWQWNEALPDIRNRIVDTIASIGDKTALPVKIRLGVIIISPGASVADPYQSPPSDHIEWIAEPDGIRENPDSERRLDIGIIEPLLQAETADSLIGSLLSVTGTKEAAWYFFDLSLTAPVELAQDPNDSNIDIGHIVDGFVEPWLKWVK